MHLRSGEYGYQRGYSVDQDKRRHRQLKRDIKQTGQRKRRQFLKRQLEENPEEAQHAEYELGRDSSAEMNGNDQDSTRKRDGSSEE